MKFKVYSICLDDDSHSFLKECKQLHGKSYSETVRTALFEFKKIKNFIWDEKKAIME